MPSQPRRPPAPPELMDELLGEILLRIPPDEPAHLVHAALVCKSWLRILSDPVFNRGYRERHRSRPPFLGFIHNLNLDDKGPIPRFVSTTSSPCSQPALDCRFWWALDSRHGRVLVHRFGPDDLAVWDPITCNLQQLPVPPYPHSYFTGAVICAVAGCDHLDCTGGGPFRVVFVGTGDDDEESFAWASAYSSETRDWSTMATADPGPGYYVETKPSVLVGDALYFTLEFGMAILKYDLTRHALSVIDAPEVNDNMGIVMAAVDGGLGFATISGRNLHLWSCLTGDDDGNSTRWTLCRDIQIQSLLPIPRPEIGHDVIGFAEGTDTIFIKTDAAVFTLDIKSGKMKKVGERGAYFAVLPYMSFCAPVCAAGCLPSP